MKIDKSYIINKLNNPKIKATKDKIIKTVKKVPKGAYEVMVPAALFLAIIAPSKCSNDNSSVKEEYPIEIYEPVNTSERDNYIEKTPSSVYKIQNGDNPEKIAKKFNVSTERLLTTNGLKAGDYIFPGESLLIPEAQKVVNVKNIQDVAKLTGYSEEFLNKLCELESVHAEPYKDKFGNWTVGVGHLIKSDAELKNYQGRTMPDEEIYTLLGQDLLNDDLDLQVNLDEEVYNSIPQCIKEGTADLMFNKGFGAAKYNDAIMEGLRNADYEKVVSNLTQDYSVRTAKDGSKKHIPASGLSKRRLYDISIAARYFKGDIPESVMEAAKKVYDRGLVYMEQEKDRGEIAAAAYKNVRDEYKDLAYQWFNGKIGEQRMGVKVSDTKTTPEAAEKENTTNTETTTPTAPATQNADTPADKVKIYAAGGLSTDYTVGSLYTEWTNTAKRNKREVTRPKPVVDKNGNIVADVKVLEPTSKSGCFKGMTFIINPGHGGCMNNTTKDKNGKVKANLNFDPGTSNAVMSKKNPNVETNTFIENNGKSLEEWVVNMRLADNLSDKIRAAGGKVIYVQGSVYSAQDAIRDIVKKNKVNAMVSLHSNSAGNTRGILVINNKRGGTDVKDKALAQKVEARMNQHDWFRGIVAQTEQSLGVLSKSKTESLDIPAIMVETGNLKNKTDIANLNSRTFKEYMVDAIFGGLQDYLK